MPTFKIYYTYDTKSGVYAEACYTTVHENAQKAVDECRRKLGDLKGFRITKAFVDRGLYWGYVDEWE